MFIENVTNMLNSYKELVERRLDELTTIGDSELYSSVVEAVRYSLLNAGKRVRPALTLEFCKATGGNAADALDCACAVEMIHTYSLIHDDLPCMDDDDMRRGRPSCHKVYGEAIALLAGDALQSLAAQTIAQCTTMPAESLLNASAELARLSGISGMIGGQVIDLSCEGKETDIDTLLAMDKGKTCALIEAACVMGCFASNASEEVVAIARKYAFELGMAFQIIDDILDVVGDEKELGKPIASDAENGKSNYVTLLGLEEAMKRAEQHTQNAVGALEPLGEKADSLKYFAMYLFSRTH